jgi:ribonuclease HII
MKYVIGIDEVGRGPIAGPLVVCACAVQAGVDIIALFPKGELKDSKKLSEKARITIVEKLLPFVENSQIFFGIGEVPAEKIDTIGLVSSIKEATQQALKKVHEQGVEKESFIFLDGALRVDELYNQETIIKGDEKVPEIALASILAKTHRDTFMKKIAEAYPGYGFENHVGYGTKAHYEAIKQCGLTPLHRRSFLKGLDIQ